MVCVEAASLFAIMPMADDNTHNVVAKMCMAIFRSTGKNHMETVTVSPKYQVVLTKAVREALGIKAGQKMVIIAYDNRVVLIPERSIQEARGSLKGMDVAIERDEEERL